MDIKKLSPRVGVTGQLVATDLATAAAQGIKSIINNRPDKEAPDQPASDDLAAAAAALGMVYLHIPVFPGSISEENIANFKSACQDLQGPILAFCRSGMRSASLWALSESTTLHYDDVLATTSKAGYDLTAMRPYMASLAASASSDTFNTRFGFGKKTDMDFDDAIAKVTAELKKEGFGVLSDIDVAATLKSKIDADIPDYRILGACNPALAHQAVSAEPEIGLLLPCNVLVRAEDNGRVSVSFMDPGAVLGLVDNADVAPLAAQVKEKLTRVLAAI